nr:hypothetical protein [Tepidiforma sp.]
MPTALCAPAGSKPASPPSLPAPTSSRASLAPFAAIASPGSSSTATRPASGALPAGAPTETDTRNLAVRRAVFERLRFDERFRRVGDTAFGLHAERLGCRVAYAPAMRVDHDHDRGLRIFAAQQVCHGWGAQRLMLESPGLPWHGGQLRQVARLAPRISSLPGRPVLAGGLRRASLAAAGALEAAAPRLPFPVAAALLAGIDKTALLAGHLSYRPGDPEPSPSGLLGRRLPRD